MSCSVLFKFSNRSNLFACYFISLIICNLKSFLYSSYVDFSFFLLFNFFFFFFVFDHKLWDNGKRNDRILLNHHCEWCFCMPVTNSSLHNNLNCDRFVRKKCITWQNVKFILFYLINNLQSSKNIFKIRLAEAEDLHFCNCFFFNDFYRNKLAYMH